LGYPNRKAIFERFIQADISDKTSRNRFSLSISKAYVEMLGGKIWVESEEGKVQYSILLFRIRLTQKKKMVLIKVYCLEN
jgi:signal transduction histidine kinase